MAKNDPRPSTSKHARMETRAKTRSKEAINRHRSSNLIGPTENEIVVSVPNGVVKLEEAESHRVIVKGAEDSSQQEIMEVTNKSAEIVKLEESAVEEVRFVTEELDIKTETTVEELNESSDPTAASSVNSNEYLTVTRTDLQFLREEINKLKELWTESKLEIQVLKNKMTKLELQLGSSNTDTVTVQQAPSLLPEAHDHSNPKPRSDEQFVQEIVNLEESQVGQLTGRKPKRSKTIKKNGEKLKKFSCDVPGCGMTFHIRQHLYGHRNRKHKQNILDCSDCGKQFHRSDHLLYHKAKHTSDRPFRCPNNDCSSTFKTKNSVYQHRKHCGFGKANC